MRERDDQQRVAVLRRIRHQLGADHAAGAGAVVDDELLAEPLARVACAIMRPTVSLMPPGGNGMMIRTGLVG